MSAPIRSVLFRARAPWVLAARVRRNSLLSCPSGRRQGLAADRPRQASRGNFAEPDPPRTQVVNPPALPVVGKRQHSELRVTKQQRVIKISFALRIVADHQNVGAGALGS